jgi:hypothetical protein
MKIPEIHWREPDPFEKLCMFLLLVCFSGIALMLAVIGIVWLAQKMF